MFISGCLWINTNQTHGPDDVWMPQWNQVSKSQWPQWGWALWGAPGKQHGSQAPLWHSSHSYPFLAHSVFCFHFGRMDFPGGSAGEESACNVGDLGSIPGLGRSPGEGNGYLLQYSGLENAMDCIVHGVTKSGTWLSSFHFHSTHLFAIDSKLLQRKNPIWWIFMFLTSPIFNRYSCTRRIKTEGCGWWEVGEDHEHRQQQNRNTERVRETRPRPLLEAGVKAAPEVHDQQNFRKWFPGFRQNVHVTKTDKKE